MYKKMLSVFAVLALLSSCDCAMHGTHDGDDMHPTSPGYMETDLVVSETENLGAAFPEGDRVHYETNKYNVSPQYQNVLEEQAEWLKKNPGVSIIIEGHCDERGTREYNLALGERRANAVKDYLLSLGIHPARLTTISYGKDRPLVIGSSPEVWAMNRVSVTVVQ